MGRKSKRPDLFIAAAQMAGILGFTSASVRRWVRENVVRARRDVRDQGRQIFVAVDDVRAYLEYQQTRQKEPLLRGRGRPCRERFTMAQAVARLDEFLRDLERRGIYRGIEE